VSLLPVTFVVPSLRPASGWGSLAAGAVRALERHAGIQASVVVSTADVPLAASEFRDCPRYAVPRTQFLSTRPGGWPAFLATWVRTHTMRVPASRLVHSLEAYPTGLVGHWLAGRMNRPHVITAAGTYAVRWVDSAVDRRLYGRVLRRAQAVLPISTGTADLMQAHFGHWLDRTRVRVVTLGTDYPVQVPREVALDRTRNTAPVILSVGAIKPRKGYETSLRAFARVKARVPEARYRIIGAVDRPDYFERLQRLVAAERIAGVEWLTAVGDVELDRHYREADIFLLTPEQVGLAFEGFGLVYLEAGAYGLPVVATRTGGVPDAVRHDETGLLASPGRADEVADCLLKLLEDPVRATRLGRANRDWSEHLTWERFARAQRDIYEQVLAGSPPGLERLA
jgi:phosphatidylinositol alpha-1,6-mannosyltransferase